MVTLPLINSWTCDFVIFLSICDSMPNGSVYCFNHLYNIWVLTYISGLVKSISERSLSGKKSQFLSKSGFAVTLGFTFRNLGYILSANNIINNLLYKSSYQGLKKSEQYIYSENTNITRFFIYIYRKVKMINSNQSLYINMNLL